MQELHGFARTDLLVSLFLGTDLLAADLLGTDLLGRIC